MTAYLRHRVHPANQWGTACGASWQGWQAPDGLALSSAAILGPYGDPAPLRLRGVRRAGWTTQGGHVSEPDEYARAVIHKALEETGVTGDIDAATDLTYRMLLAGAMLQSAYWPRDYIESIRGAATPMGTCDQNCMCRG